MTTLLGALHAVLAWPSESQLQARRNAMRAATELTRRRQERVDVEAYLDQHVPRPALPDSLDRRDAI